jgi:hypothetical protein
MKRLAILAALFCCCLGTSLRAADERVLSENSLHERLRNLAAQPDPGERLRRAKEVLRMHWLSSQQVKTIAARLNDDAQRLEFATAAYPRTVDPENFYDVYDAFSSFSKVMRLHDRLHHLEAEPATTPVVTAPPTLSEDEMRDILRALRKESFDKTREQTARQIIASSRTGFLAAQVKQILGCFDFDPTRLEIAKFAYDYTIDREKYYMVNDAFSFDNTKSSLAQYLESRRQPAKKNNP